jgi:low temperature requirement protein LtrA
VAATDQSGDPMQRTLRAPPGQPASFVELFFDLVFVFAVTQVTMLTVDDLTARGVGRAVLVFWLIWWAWTQFTWTLNPADTKRGTVQAITLLATAAAFVMAASVRFAFGGQALWFVIPYLVVRLLGLGLQVAIAREGNQGRVPIQVLWWSMLSIVGLVAVLAGAFVQVPARSLVWVGAIALDVVAAVIGGSADEPWDLNAGHLAERHGLFVIIAIGESLIIAGTAAANQDRTLDLVGLAGAGLAAAGLLWWSYFGWLKDDLEEAFSTVAPSERGSAARDAYSLAHFPLVCGIVGFAVAADRMVLHRTDPVDARTLAALAIGTMLFMGATVLSYRRLRRRVLWPRLLITLVATVSLSVVEGAQPVWPLTIVAIGLAVVGLVERERIGGNERRGGDDR